MGADLKYVHNCGENATSKQFVKPHADMEDNQICLLKYYSLKAHVLILAFTLYLNSTTFQRQSLYILLHYNYLKAAVTVTLKINALNTIKYDVYTLGLVKLSLCQPSTTYNAT